MSDASGNDLRHEGASFEPVPRDLATDAGLGGSYPPEADPDKGGDMPDAEVPGEQTDPDRRLTGGEQPAGESEVTQDDLLTPGSVEPPD